MTDARKNLKALIVEDDDDTAKLISKVLHKAGMISSIGYNGAMGLKLFIEEKPDIVFSNFIMPEKGGVWLFHEIRSLDYKVPVILFSGRYWELNRKFDREPIKPNYMLKKPFSVMQIYEILQECFPESMFSVGLEDLQA